MEDSPWHPQLMVHQVLKFAVTLRSKSHQNDRLASLEVKASAKGRNIGTDALTRTKSFK